jgi:hypothetical protein
MSKPQSKIGGQLSGCGFTIALLVVIACMVCGGLGGWIAGTH